MSYGMGPTGLNQGTTPTGAMKPFKEKVPKGYGVSRIQQYTPEAMELYRNLFSNLGPESYLGRLAGGDQSLFGEIEAPALKQFSSLQGNLASRFSGMGAGGRQQALGGRHTSGFQVGMNQAASDFAQQLQSQRQGLMRQAIMDLHGLSSDLLDKRPYETQLYEKQQKQSKGAGYGALGGAALGGLIGLAGGPIGALGGAQLGHAIGSAF